MQKQIVSSLFFLIISLNIFSNELENAASKDGTIKGFVIDSMTNYPLEYATVTLYKTFDNSLVTGTITDENGFFRLKDIPFGNYRVEFTFIGYTTKKLSDLSLNSTNSTFNTGQIMIEPTQASLNEIIVAADRPTMSYQIDKKVINVSQQHVSASGTAVEILENIPSITVSIEGDVSLRGSSSFTVLVDGRPSILDANDLLNQIPASQIESIEIITNPSARFDPDGVAGIINIVMKKQKLQGFNGVVNANAGNHNRYGGDFLINFRKERFNYYFGADYNNRGMTGKRENISETVQTDTTFLHSNGDFNRGGYSWGARGGLDFNINPKNTLSISYRLGDRKRESINNMIFREWNSENNTPIEYTSFELSERGGFSHSLNANYKKSFQTENHNIFAQVVLSARDGKEYSRNYLYDNLENITNGQQASEIGPGNRASFMLDYTLPINDVQKFESGYHLNMNLSEDVSEMLEYDNVAMDFVLNELYSKQVEYQNTIHALYSTFSGEYNKFGYQFGLRGEYTDRLTRLIGETNEYPLNRWDLYPTLHFSYQLPHEQQMMTSYTRRLQRLRGWYLEPFYTWSNAYNIRIGNPALNPEYIDSYEISYQNRFNRNVLSVDLYYRITHNKIERVRSVFEGYDNVLLTTFENVGKDYSLGTEIMFNFEPLSWWNIDLMGNIYDYKMIGELDGREFSAYSFNWNLRLNNNIKLAKSTRLQITGMYYSPTVMAQGTSGDFFMINMAIKQDFLKNSLSITLQARDIFSTMGREYTSRGIDFYTYNKWAPDTPIITLTASYRINNYNQRQNRPQNGDVMNEINGDEGE
jgi:outer membrane cobalamin receptor